MLGGHEGHGILARVEVRAELVGPDEVPEGFLRLGFEDDAREDVVLVLDPVREFEPDPADPVLEDLDLVRDVPVHIRFHVVNYRTNKFITGRARKKNY